MKQRLSDAVDDFLEYRGKIEDRSVSTVTNDRGRLVKLLTTTGNIWCENVTNTHVTQSLIVARDTNSPRSLVGVISTYRVFFQWCRDHKRMTPRSDPMAGVKAPRWHVEERNILPVSKFRPLLDSATCPRDRILLASALYSLKRAGEIKAWRVGDLDMQACKIRTHLFKSKKDDRTPMGDEWMDEMRTWLMAYQAECGPLQPEWFLIPGRSTPTFKKGRGVYPARIDQDTLRLLPDVKLRRPGPIATYALKAVGFETRDPKTGVAKGEGMHTFRRSGGRARFDALRDSGYDGALEELRETFGHKFASQTEAYLGVSLSRQRRDENIIGHKFYPQLEGDNVVHMGRLQDAPIGTEWVQVQARG